MTHTQLMGHVSLHIYVWTVKQQKSQEKEEERKKWEERRKQKVNKNGW